MQSLQALFWSVEGTRLANFTSEKNVFINMHGHPLPLKQAFVAQQIPKTQRSETEPDQQENQIDTGVWWANGGAQGDVLLITECVLISFNLNCLWDAWKDLVNIF